MAIKRKFPPRVATVYCSGGCRAKKDEDGALLCAYGCIGCGLCVKNCPADAIHIEQFHAVIDAARCLSCGQWSFWILQKPIRRRVFAPRQSAAHCRTHSFSAAAATA